MIWCRFQVGDKVSYGIVEGDQVKEVSGSPFGTHSLTGASHPFSGIKLLVPVVPPTFYAGGLNYRAHARWWAEYSKTPLREATEPIVGYRTNNALIAQDESIVKPKDSSAEFQIEAELVAVIGKTAKHLSTEEALSCVLGYTIGNDVSERTWQIADGSLWRAKNSDTFKPMGPWIATGLDPTGLDTTIRINGNTVLQFNTRDMIFGVAEHISKISRYCSLHPGDVVWMGAEGAPTPNMAVGDLVELEISGIGTLRTPVVAEQP